MNEPLFEKIDEDFERVYGSVPRTEPNAASMVLRQLTTSLAGKRFDLAEGHLEARATEDDNRFQVTLTLSRQDPTTQEMVEATRRGLNEDEAPIVEDYPLSCKVIKLGAGPSQDDLSALLSAASLAAASLDVNQIVHMTFSDYIDENGLGRPSISIFYTSKLRNFS